MIKGETHEWDLRDVSKGLENDRQIVLCGNFMYMNVCVCT